MLGSGGTSAGLLGITIVALVFWAVYIGAAIWIARYGRWSRQSFVGLLAVGLIGTPLVSGVVVLVTRGRYTETGD